MEEHRENHPEQVERENSSAPLGLHSYNLAARSQQHLAEEEEEGASQPQQAPGEQAQHRIHIINRVRRINLLFISMIIARNPRSLSTIWHCGWLTGNRDAAVSAVKRGL